MRLAKRFLHSGLLFSIALAFFLSQGCRTGKSNPELAGVPHIRWAYTPGPDPLSGIAIAHNGTLHFAATDGIYALSPEGKLIWKSPLPSGPVVAAPAIAPNGTLYAAAKSGSLFALDASGRLLWQSANVQHKFFTPPALGNSDAVYVADDYTNLFAFAPGQGRDLLWKQMTYSATGSGEDILLGSNSSYGPYGDGTWRSSPAIAADDMLYLAHQQWLYRLSLHGDVLWFLQLGAGQLGFPAIGGAGMVYVEGHNPPWLFAIGHDGKQRWLVRTSGPLRGSPVVDNAEVIYFCDSDFVKALEPDGHAKWSTQAECNSGPVLAADGTLYLGLNARDEGGGARKSFLSAFTPDGHLRWKVEIQGMIREAPAIAPDGTTYFTTDRGFAFSVSDAGAPPMDSPWPRFQHDAQNSGHTPLSH
jgi:outer membrane protein assembly factor BamB